MGSIQHIIAFKTGMSAFQSPCQDSCQQQRTGRPLLLHKHVEVIMMNLQIPAAAYFDPSNLAGSLLRRGQSRSLFFVEQ